MSDMSPERAARIEAALMKAAAEMREEALATLARLDKEKADLAAREQELIRQIALSGKPK